MPDNWDDTKLIEETGQNPFAAKKEKRILPNAIEIIVKLAIDMGVWAWATSLLAKGLGWEWSRMALVTLGVAMLVNSLKSWGPWTSTAQN